MATKTPLADMKIRMWNAVFKKYDTDQDGDLTWEEMKPVFTKLFDDIDQKVRIWFIGLKLLSFVNISRLYLFVFVS